MSRGGYTSEARLRRAAVENLRLAIADLRVQRKHGRVEIGIGPRLQLEVAEGVDAANESRAAARTAGLADARGNVADGEADAAIPGRVSARAVHHQHVMERHFSSLEDDVGGPRLVHLHGDLLAAREEIVGMKRVDVG